MHQLAGRSLQQCLLDTLSITGFTAEKQLIQFSEHSAPGTHAFIEKCCSQKQSGSIGSLQLQGEPFRIQNIEFRKHRHPRSVQERSPYLESTRIESHIGHLGER
jgi:hypothetical protein